jgi:hypothetical protein
VAEAVLHPGAHHAALPLLLARAAGLLLLLLLAPPLLPWLLQVAAAARVVVARVVGRPEWRGHAPPVRTAPDHVHPSAPAEAGHHISKLGMLGAGSDCWHPSSMQTPGARAAYKRITVEGVLKYMHSPASNHFCLSPQCPSLLTCRMASASLYTYS